MNRSRLILIFTSLALLVLAGVWLMMDTSESVKTRDVVYGRKSGMALTMDVIQPENPNGIGVIFLVSAGFRSDARWVESGFIQPEFYAPFLKRGQTVFLVGHSANPKFVVREIIKDVYRAIRFVRYHAAEYNVNSDRLAITGASSGGYLSLLVSTGVGNEMDTISESIPGNMLPQADPVDSVSVDVQAVGVFYAPADLMNYSKDGQSYLERAPDFVYRAWGLENKSKEEQLAELRSLSPYEYISKQTPPVILVHGSRDPYVPIRQSERFFAKLKANQVSAELIVKEGGNHGWGSIGEEYEKVAEWFDEHLMSNP